MHSGATAMANQCWHSALRYTGSAYEASQALLGKPELVTDNKALSYTDRFMIAGHYLSEIHRKTGQLDHAEDYLVSVHQRLVSIFRDNDTYLARKVALLVNIRMSLQIMRCFYSKHGDISAYNSIFFETQRLME